MPRGSSSRPRPWRSSGPPGFPPDPGTGAARSPPPWRPPAHPGPTTPGRRRTPAARGPDGAPARSSGASARTGFGAAPNALVKCAVVAFTARGRFRLHGPQNRPFFFIGLAHCRHAHFLLIRALPLVIPQSAGGTPRRLILLLLHRTRPDRRRPIHASSRATRDGFLVRRRLPAGTAPPSSRSRRLPVRQPEQPSSAAAHRLAPSCWSRSAFVALNAVIRRAVCDIRSGCGTHGRRPALRDHAPSACAWAPAGRNTHAPRHLHRPGLARNLKLGFPTCSQSGGWRAPPVPSDRRRAPAALQRPHARSPRPAWPRAHGRPRRPRP